MSTPESLDKIKKWCKFERWLHGEVWGYAVQSGASPSDKTNAGRTVEQRAVHTILPKEGFSDIFWLSENSHSFPIDAVASRDGQRFLIEITSAVAKKMATKMWFVEAMKMPVLVLHVSPKNNDVYFIQSKLTDGLYSNVPSQFMHGLAVKAGIEHEYIPAKPATCVVCGSQFAKFSNRPTKVCSDECVAELLSRNSKARGVRPPYLENAIGSDRRGSKLHDEDIRQIRSMTGLGTRKIAELFGVSNALVRGIRSGQKWKHVV
jgi:hypothetical protein